MRRKLFNLSKSSFKNSKIKEFYNLPSKLLSHCIYHDLFNKDHDIYFSNDDLINKFGFSKEVIFKSKQICFDLKIQLNHNDSKEILSTIEDNICSMVDNIFDVNLKIQYNDSIESLSNLSDQSNLNDLPILQNAQNKLIKSQSHSNLFNYNSEKFNRSHYSSLKREFSYNGNKNISSVGSGFVNTVMGKGIIKDNSLMIQDFISHNNTVILITMPRRSGKSHNLDMINQYINLNKKENKFLFNNLKINQNETFQNEHQNKYPVIFLNFQNTKDTNLNESLQSLRTIISDAFKQHDYLLKYKLINEIENNNRLNKDKKIKLREDDDIYFLLQVSQHITLSEDLLKFIGYYQGDKNYIKNKGEFNQEIQNLDLEYSIKFLSQELYFYHKKKVYILVDEYDAVTNNAFNNYGKYSFDTKTKKFGEDFHKLNINVSKMMTMSLKDNEFLEKALLTGILRTSKNDMLSGLNNVKEYNLLSSKFIDYYGFNKKEIIDHCLELNIDYTKYEKQFKETANGYYYGQKADIYNIWSVINLFTNIRDNDPDKDEAWSNSGGLNLIRELITSTSCQYLLHKLYNNEAIIINEQYHISYEKLLTGNIETMFNILLWTGYLTPLQNTENIKDNELLVKIPNKPVRQVFKEQIIDWSKNIGISLKEISFYIEQILTDKNKLNKVLQEFNEELARQLNDAKDEEKIEKFNEHLLHDIICGSLIETEKAFQLISDVAFIYNSKKRTDIAFKYKLNNELLLGVIIELKYNKKVKDALKQIEEKEYYKGFNDSKEINKILAIGINIDDKNDDIIIDSGYDNYTRKNDTEWEGNESVNIDTILE